MLGSPLALGTAAICRRTPRPLRRLATNTCTSPIKRYPTPMHPHTCANSTLYFLNATARDSSLYEFGGMGVVKEMYLVLEARDQRPRYLGRGDRNARCRRSR